MKCLSRILCRSFMCKCRSFHRLSGNKKLKTPKVHLVARKTQTSWHQFCRRGWHEKKPHQKPVLLGWFKQLKIVTLSTFRPRWHMDWSHEKMSNLDTQRHTLRPRRVTEEQGQESIQLSPAGVRGHRVTQTTEKRDCEKQSCQSLREKGSKSRDRVGMHISFFCVSPVCATGKLEQMFSFQIFVGDVAFSPHKHIWSSLLLQSQ